MPATPGVVRMKTARARVTIAAGTVTVTCYVGAVMTAAMTSTPHVLWVHGYFTVAAVIC